MNDIIKKINNICVLGAGISGMEVVRWAVSQGKMVTVGDLKPLEKLESEFVDFCKENQVVINANGHGPDIVSHADLVVVSPGISPKSPIIEYTKEKGIPIMGEIDLAIRLWKGPVIGITGTNGKTTTTSLTGYMFSCAGIPCVVAGNIGRPLIGFVTEGKNHYVAVLEVSSFQIDYFSDLKGWGSPFFSSVAITNITPDHLDRYDNFEDYVYSKFRIFDFIRDDSNLVVNSNLMENYQDFFHKKRNIVSFGENRVCEFYSSIERDNLRISLPFERKYEFDIRGWGLKGSHNLENLCCAAALSLLNDVPEGSVQKAIDTFKAPLHRLQFVDKIDGVEFYNDSKATNVSSVMKALDALLKPVVVILGGRGKGESYLPLISYAKNGRIKGVVLIGEEGLNIGEVFNGLIPCKYIKNRKDGFETMDFALLSAKEMAEKGDVVLLSPACASFDMFRNYEERGEAFIKSVKKLKGEYE